MTEDADEKARRIVEVVSARVIGLLRGKPVPGTPHLGYRVYGFRLEGSRPDESLSPETVSLVLDHFGMVIAVTTTRRTASFQKAPRGMIRASSLSSFLGATKALLKLRGVESQQVSEVLGRFD